MIQKKLTELVKQIQTEKEENEKFRFKKKQGI